VATGERRDLCTPASRARPRVVEYAYDTKDIKLTLPLLFAWNPAASKLLSHKMSMGSIARTAPAAGSKQTRRPPAAARRRRQPATGAPGAQARYPQDQDRRDKEAPHTGAVKKGASKKAPAKKTKRKKCRVTKGAVENDRVKKISNKEGNCETAKKGRAKKGKCKSKRSCTKKNVPIADLCCRSEPEKGMLYRNCRLDCHGQRCWARQLAPPSAKDCRHSGLVGDSGSAPAAPMGIRQSRSGPPRRRADAGVSGQVRGTTRRPGLGGQGRRRKANASRTACRGDDRSLSDGTSSSCRDHYITDRLHRDESHLHRRNAIGPAGAGTTALVGKWVDAGSAGRYTTLEVATRGLKGPRKFEASGIACTPTARAHHGEHNLGQATRTTVTTQITTIGTCVTARGRSQENTYAHNQPNLIWYSMMLPRKTANVFICGRQRFRERRSAPDGRVKRRQKPTEPCVFQIDREMPEPGG